MNVDSVQVLKGPQGTLFGHNTTGGAILIQTAEPSTDPTLDTKFSLSRYNETRAQGYVSTGLTDRIAVDLEGSYDRGDGWQRNISNGRRVGDFRDWSVRTGLKVELTDGISVLLRYQRSYVDDPAPALVASYLDPGFGSGAPNFAQPGEVTFRHNEVASGTLPQDQEFLRIKSDIFQGTIKADLGFADLTSYTQYRQEKVNSNLELDYSGAQVFELGLPNTNKTWSQEVLLTSKAGSKLQWTAGFFAFGNKDIYTTYFSLAGLAVLTASTPTPFVAIPGVPMPGVPFSPQLRIGGSGTNTKSVAGFVDATYELTPQLFLTAGVRYAHDSVTGAYFNSLSLPPFDAAVKQPVPGISSNHVTPRAVIRYKPTADSSIYASFTRGYKSPIIDVGGTCQNSVNLPTPNNPTGAGFTCNPIKAETINAYEAGIKLSRPRLSVELSGFYYDYKNLQVSIYLAGQANIVNAATSRIYGADGQVRFNLTDSIELNAGGAYTHARYRNFPIAPIYQKCSGYAGCFGGIGGTSFQVVLVPLKNVTMQRAPEFTGTAGASYRTDLAKGKLELSGNYYYSSKLYYGPSGVQFPQKGYGLLALRGQWTDPSDHLTLALFGDNVTGTRYKSEVQASSFGIGTNWNKPATYGVEIGYHF